MSGERAQRAVDHGRNAEPHKHFQGQIAIRRPLGATIIAKRDVQTSKRPNDQKAGERAKGRPLENVGAADGHKDERGERQGIHNSRERREGIFRLHYSILHIPILHISIAMSMCLHMFMHISSCSPPRRSPA